MSTKLAASVTFLFANASKLRQHPYSRDDDVKVMASQSQSYNRQDELEKCVSDAMSSRLYASTGSAYHYCVNKVDEKISTEILPTCISTLIDRDGEGAEKAKELCESDPWYHIIDDRVCPAEPFKPATESTAHQLAELYRDQLDDLKNAFNSFKSHAGSVTLSEAGVQKAGLFLANGIFSILMTLINAKLSHLKLPAIPILVAQNIGAVMGSVIVLLTGLQELKEVKSDHIFPALIQGALSVAVVVSSLYGFKFASPALLALGSNARPVMSAALEYLVYGKKLSNKQMLGLLVILAGVGFFAAYEFAAVSSTAIFYAFLNPFFVAISSIYDQSKYMENIRKEQTPVAATMYRLVAATLLAPIAGSILGGPAAAAGASIATLSTVHKALLLGSSLLCLGMGVVGVFLDRNGATGTEKQVAAVGTKTFGSFFTNWLTNGKPLTTQGLIGAITSAAGVMGFAASPAPK